MSFTTEIRQRSRPALPLAGMVDVLFLLLIFFMTASVFREQESTIPVDLTPAETAQADTSTGTHTVVTVKKDGTIYFGGGTVTLPTLRSKLTQLADQFPDEVVVIRGDRSSNFGLFIRILDLAKEAEVRDVRVAASKPESDAS
jgi:biopolymer transport protein ExbD